MSIENILFELGCNHNDKHYIDLAKKEILLVPVIIDLLSESKEGSRKRLFVLLEKIALDNPTSVYPFFNYIFNLTQSKEPALRGYAWHILAGLSRCDFQNKWEQIFDKFEKLLETSSIADFSVACGCAAEIAQNKTVFRDRIINSLSNVENRSFYLGDSANEACKLIAVQKATDVLQSLEESPDNKSYSK